MFFLFNFFQSNKYSLIMFSSLPACPRSFIFPSSLSETNRQKQTPESSQTNKIKNAKTRQKVLKKAWFVLHSPTTPIHLACTAVCLMCLWHLVGESIFPFASRCKRQTASWLEVGGGRTTHVPFPLSVLGPWLAWTCVCYHSLWVYMYISPVTSGRQFPWSRCPHLHLLPCSSLDLKGRGWWWQHVRTECSSWALRWSALMPALRR